MMKKKQKKLTLLALSPIMIERDHRRVPPKAMRSPSPSELFIQLCSAQPDKRYSPNTDAKAAIHAIFVILLVRHGAKYETTGTTITYIVVINAHFPPEIVTRDICCKIAAIPSETPTAPPLVQSVLSS